MPNIGTISPSKLKRMRLCEARAFAIQFDDDYEDEIKQEGTLAGTLCHAACKVWYRPSVEWQQIVDSLPPEQIPEATRQRVINGVPKHPITDPNVAFQMAIADVAKDQELPREAASVLDASEMYNKAINTHVRDNIVVVFAERRYKGKLNNGVPVHLIIDLGVDRGGDTLSIIDFKSGYVTISDEDAWSDEQALLNLVATMRDPNLAYFANKTFQFSWLRTSKVSEPVILNNQGASNYESWLMWEYDRLFNLKEDEAKRTLNRYCDTCGIRSTCGKYIAMMSEAMSLTDNLTVESLATLPDDDVAEKIVDSQLQSKILDKRISTLKGYLGNKLKSAQKQSAEGKKYKYRWRSHTTTNLNTGLAISLAMSRGKDLQDLFTPRVKAIRSVFEGDQSALQQLDAATKKFTVPSWVEVIAVKEAKVPTKPK